VSTEGDDRQFNETRFTYLVVEAAAAAAAAGLLLLFPPRRLLVPTMAIDKFIDNIFYSVVHSDKTATEMLVNPLLLYAANLLPLGSGVCDG
jgi:hypothetical protein